MTEILIRDGVAGDINFIFATWLKHYKSNSYFAKRIPDGIYYKRHHGLIERALTAPGTRVLIAYPESEPEVIFGFMVTNRHDDKDIIHFMFTKRELRRTGIARRMFEASGLQGTIEFTHWTYLLNDFIHHYPAFRYNPYEV